MSVPRDASCDQIGQRARRQAGQAIAITSSRPPISPALVSQEPTWLLRSAPD
jgi:hypothetical protein